MMRDDDWTCQELDNGYCIVCNRGAALEWRAWRDWLASEFGRICFPDVMTVWMPFPPTTQIGADIVGQKIRDIRKEIGGCAPVPLHPKPWRGPSGVDIAAKKIESGQKNVDGCKIIPLEPPKGPRT